MKYITDISYGVPYDGLDVGCNDGTKSHLEWQVLPPILANNRTAFGAYIEVIRQALNVDEAEAIATTKRSMQFSREPFHAFLDYLVEIGCRIYDCIYNDVNWETSTSKVMYTYRRDFGYPVLEIKSGGRIHTLNLWAKSSRQEPPNGWDIVRLDAIVNTYKQQLNHQRDLCGGHSVLALSRQALNPSPLALTKWASNFVQELSDAMGFDRNSEEATEFMKFVARMSDTEALEMLSILEEPFLLNKGLEGIKLLQKVMQEGGY